MRRSDEVRGNVSRSADSLADKAQFGSAVLLAEEAQACARMMPVFLLLDLSKFYRGCICRDDPLIPFNRARDEQPPVRE